VCTVAVVPAELPLERDVTETVVPVRRCDGRGRFVASSSDGAEDEDCDVGGEVLLPTPVKTRAHGARVLRVGPRSGRDSIPPSLLPSCRFGRVKAQLSQGPARRVT
jgi:hypothetical protein